MTTSPWWREKIKVYYYNNLWVDHSYQLMHSLSILEHFLFEKYQLMSHFKYEGECVRRNSKVQIESIFIDRKSKTLNNILYDSC